MTLDFARRLWGSDDPDDWRGALEAYEAVVAGQGVNGLVDLDAWYRLELPKQLSSRVPSFVTRAELVEVVRWKMKRGEWRARNLSLVQGNSDERVRAASTAAFEAVPHPRQPLAILSQLDGVGPATASAVLLALRPELYPFFDDLVARSVPSLDEPKFTLPYYLRYAEALQARAASLAEDWSAHAVGQALWAAAGGKAAVS